MFGPLKRLVVHFLLNCTFHLNLSSCNIREKICCDKTFLICTLKDIRHVGFKNLRNHTGLKVSHVISSVASSLHFLCKKVRLKFVYFYNILFLYCVTVNGAWLFTKMFREWVKEGSFSIKFSFVENQLLLMIAMFIIL